MELATAASNMMHQTIIMPTVTKDTIIMAHRPTTKTCNITHRQAMTSTVISHGKDKIHSTLPGAKTTISHQ